MAARKASAVAGVQVTPGPAAVLAASEPDEVRVGRWETVTGTRRNGDLVTVLRCIDTGERHVTITPHEDN